MKIAIDLQGAQTGSRHRGIGRYSLSLVKKLSVLCQERGHELYVVLNGLMIESTIQLRNELSVLLPLDRILVFDAIGPTKQVDEGNIWRRQASELVRGAFFRYLGVDVILATSIIEGYDDDFVFSAEAFNAGQKIAAIFYDLIPLIHKDIYLGDLNHRRWYENRIQELKKVDLLLSISLSSTSEAKQFLNVSQENITCIGGASDPLPLPRLDTIENDSKSELLNRLGINKPYLMYSSATDPRKNHLGLIDAYAKLSYQTRRNHVLVLAGRLPKEHQDRFEAYAIKSGLSKSELIITGSLTDEEMAILYKNAKAYIFPSWHEGFGLPILEAMQFGRAVIGSNVSSIPEIIDLEEAVFNPRDVDEITQKIERVLNDDSWRDRLEYYATERYKEFTWDKVAQKTLDALEDKFTKSIGDKNKYLSSTELIEENLIRQIASLCIKSNPSASDLIGVAIAIANNRPKRKRKQLLVDISVLCIVDAETGIQRVVRSVIHEWLKQTVEEFEINLIYASVGQPYRYANQYTGKIVGKSPAMTDEIVEYSPGDVFLGLDLLHHNIAEYQKSFYRRLRAFGVIVKFVVYDLLPISLSKYADDGVPEGFAKWLKITAESDGVICISSSVAEEYSEWLQDHQSELASPRFSVDSFYLGSDIILNAIDIDANQSSAELIKNSRGDRHFLSVGTLEPRKAHAQMLSGFDILWARGEDVTLTFVGKKGWKTEEFANKLLEHQEFGRRLFWHSEACNKLLEELYKKSDCLLFASEGEGFGLPLVEAAKYGLPILARNLPIFNEICHENAIYFDGHESWDIYDAVLRWKSIFKLGQIPDSSNIHSITWSESADLLLNCLRSSVKT